MRYFMLFVCMALFAACGHVKQSVRTVAVETGKAAVNAAKGPAIAAAIKTTLAEIQKPAPHEWTPAYFDYDRSDIRADQRDKLATHARAIPSRSTVKIYGHCDERGTITYNLVLGQKRADAVKQYLVLSGVPAYSVATYSLGEEQPAVLGHSEAAWAENRRVEFEIVP